MKGVGGRILSGCTLLAKPLEAKRDKRREKMVED